LVGLPTEKTPAMAMITMIEYENPERAAIAVIGQYHGDIAIDIAAGQSVATWPRKIALSYNFKQQ